MTQGQGERVTFKTMTSDASDVAVSGNVRELGGWAIADAVDMHLQQTHGQRWEWTAQITLQHGQTIEFKFVKKTPHGIVWERGDNRRYTVIPGQHTLSDTFRE